MARMASGSRPPSDRAVAASMIATSTGPACIRSSASSRLPAALGTICHDWTCWIRVRRVVASSGITIRTPRPRSSGTTAHCPARADAAASGSRIVKWNVVPTPGSLSSQIRPPISSQSRLLIARPRPVPP